MVPWQSYIGPMHISFSYGVPPPPPPRMSAGEVLKSIQGELLGKVPYSHAFVEKARFLLTVIKPDPDDRMSIIISMALSQALRELARQEARIDFLIEALEISSDLTPLVDPVAMPDMWALAMSEEGHCLQVIAAELGLTHFAEQALVRYRLVHTTLDPDGEPLKYAENLMFIANTAEQLGSLVGTEALFHEAQRSNATARAIFETLGMAHQVGETSRHEANALAALNAIQAEPDRHARAVELYEQALAIFIQEGHNRDIATTLSNRATCLTNYGRAMRDMRALLESASDYARLNAMGTADTYKSGYRINALNQVVNRFSAGEIGRDVDLIMEELAAIEALLVEAEHDANAEIRIQIDTTRISGENTLAEWTENSDRLHVLHRNLQSIVADPELAKHPEHGSVLLIACATLCIRLGELDQETRYLREAAAILRQANLSQRPAILATVQANLCAVLGVLWRATRSPVDRTTAEQTIRAAIDGPLGSMLHNRFECLTVLAEMELSHDHAREAEALLAGAIPEAIEQVFAAPTLERQGQALKPIGDMASVLAYARLQRGDAEGALQAISAGRGVAASLAQFADRLRGADAAITSALHEARRALAEAQNIHGKCAERLYAIRYTDEGATDSADPSQVAELEAALHHAAATLAERHAAFSAALESAGLPAFSPVPLDRVAAAIPVGGALIAITATMFGGAAIVLPAGSTQLDQSNILWLENLTDSAMRRSLKGRNDSGLRLGWLPAYEAYRRSVGPDGDADEIRTTLDDWNAEVEEMCERLGKTVMAPIDGMLRRMGLAPGAEILLMAPGEIALLPLHAATIDRHGRTVLDDWAIAHVPTLRFLVDARSQVESRDDTEDHLLGVTDPLGDFKGAGPTLANPAMEGFAKDRRTDLTEQSATLDAVVAAMPYATHLSFFCHGVFDSNNPRNSGLVLHDPVEHRALLTIAHLRALNLSRARFALLGACESAFLDAKNAPGELTGLPTAILETGVPCVIASGWITYTDTTGALVQRTFALQRGEGLSPARALRQASLELRDGLLFRVESDQAVPQFRCITVEQPAPLSPTALAPIANHEKVARWAAFSCWGV